MVLCMRCGAQNNPDENYCLSCGATLPKLAYTMEMASVNKVMDLYYKFHNAVESLRKGESTIEEFEEFVAGMQEKLTSREEEIRNVSIDDTIIEDFEAELEMGFSGVEKISAGIDNFMDFIESSDDSFLDEGLKSIHEGLELIHQARIINRQRDMRLNSDAEMYRQEQTMEL